MNKITDDCIKLQRIALDHLVGEALEQHESKKRQ